MSPVDWIAKCTIILLLAVTGSPAHSVSNSLEEDAWGGVRLFEADLSARHQTILTQSDGAGFAKVRFDINTMEMTWEVEFEGLTSSLTSITLHGPAQPGKNAVAIIDLGGQGMKSPISGTMKISARTSNTCCWVGPTFSSKQRSTIMASCAENSIQFRPPGSAQNQDSNELVTYNE